MKRTEKLIQLLFTDIEHKDILELACGAAEFSLSASDYADSVTSIDIDASRLKDSTIDRINFERMDASAMRFSDCCFDTVMIYNAFSHIQTQWSAIQAECMRVLKTNGVLCIVSTWKIDTNLMIDTFGNQAKWQDEFLIVRLKRS